MAANEAKPSGARRISGRSATALRLLFFTLALAQIADVLATNRALATGIDAHEGNPIMRFSMSELGPLWWLPKLGVAVFLVIAGIKMKRPLARTAAFATIVAAIYLGVLINNIMR